MKAITGNFDFEVWVVCPYCEKHFDLVEELEDEDCELASSVLGNNRDPANWDKIDFDFTCPNPECGEAVKMNKVEY